MLTLSQLSPLSVSQKRISFSTEKQPRAQIYSENTERKSSLNTRLILKKPIEALIKEGFFVKSVKNSTFYENSAVNRNNDLKNKTFSSLSPQQEEPSNTKQRIDDLLNDSKQLIKQGSKLLINSKKPEIIKKDACSAQNPLNKQIQNENKGFTSACVETPVKKNNIQEFQRLENKLKELESKISLLKTKRAEKVEKAEKTSSSATKPKVYNPSTEEKPIAKAQTSTNSDNYTNILQNIVTQVQPHSILPKNRYFDPDINEKFQPFQQIQSINPSSERCSPTACKEDRKYFIDSVIEAYSSPTASKRELWLDYFSQTVQCMHFLRTMEPIPLEISQQKFLSLPKTSHDYRKKTLVFDLDETLVHCNEHVEVRSDIVIAVKFGNGTCIDAGINIRPFARECLEELAKYYEIMVFTASNENYAQSVVDFLDPKHEIIQYFLSREQCILTKDGLFIKDLRVIGNRNIEDIILVDNAAYSFALQINNGIPILPFYDDKSDRELVHLTRFLIKLASCPNVRNKLKEYFKIERYVETRDSLELVKKLFRNNNNC